MSDYPPPVGRKFDPDWTWKLGLLTVVWLLAWGVGAWFFWSAVVG